MFKHFFQWLNQLLTPHANLPMLKPAPLVDQFANLTPLQPNHYDITFTATHLNLMLELKTALSADTVFQLRQNLAQLPQGTSLQLYLDYFDRIFDQINEYQVTYNVLAMLNGTLVQFVWPQSLTQGVQKLHNEVLPQLQHDLKSELPVRLQGQFQANYDQLMADYDEQAWLDLVLKSYQVGWEIDYQQALSQYLELDLDEVDFNQNYFGYSAQANLINPLLLKIQKQLTKNWFTPDERALSLQQQIEISASPEAVLDWVMIYGWLPWLYQQHGFLDYQSLAELKTGFWSHVLNNQIDDFDLLRALLGAELETDRGTGHQVASYQVHGRRVTASVKPIEFEYQSIIQTAVQRLQDLPGHVNVFEAQLRLMDPGLFERLLKHHDQDQLQLSVSKALIERFNVNYTYQDDKLLATRGQTRMVVTKDNCWLTTVDFKYEHPEPVLYVINNEAQFFHELWQTMHDLMDINGDREG